MGWHGVGTPIRALITFHMRCVLTVLMLMLIGGASLSQADTCLWRTGGYVDGYGGTD